MRKTLAYYLDLLLLLTIPIGGAFIIWFYFIDGIYLNPILSFKNGVDPMNFKLEKTEYKRGETVVGITSVIKNRRAACYVNWSLVNDIVLPFSTDEDDIKELPPGHYQGKFEIIEIPNNTVITKGQHYITGEQHCFLSGNRERIATFKTETFYVVK